MCSARPLVSTKSPQLQLQKIEGRRRERGKEEGREGGRRGEREGGRGRGRERKKEEGETRERVLSNR